MRPTGAAYQLFDESYRYVARRDPGLPPTRERIMPYRCGACRIGMAPEVYHSQWCIHNSTFNKLRHDNMLLRDEIRDGVA